MPWPLDVFLDCWGTLKQTERPTQYDSLTHHAVELESHSSLSHSLHLAYSPDF